LALEAPPDASWRVPDDEDAIDEPLIEPAVAVSLLDEFMDGRKNEPAAAE
jgi:hypothetical protein